jgi:hypothetical protein
LSGGVFYEINRKERKEHKEKFNVQEAPALVGFCYENSL